MCLHGHLGRDSVGWRPRCWYSRYGDAIPVQLLFRDWVSGGCLVVYVGLFNIGLMVLTLY